MRLVIPLKPISWNVIACKSYWTYSETSKVWKQYTYKAVKDAKLAPITKFPCKVVFEARWKGNKRHDVDALFCKPVMDTLSKKTPSNPYGTDIIPDDSIQYISSVLYIGETGADRDELIITITPV